MIGIYKIENQINHKVYIGQSKNITERWHRHRVDYQKMDYYIYRAMRKYGLENFIFSVIEECSVDKLNEREIYWIKYYDSNNPKKGYNLTKGGDSATFSLLTEEQVLEIYDLLRQPLTMTQIAEKFNVHHTTISNINLGKTWYHQDVQYPVRGNNEFNKTKMINELKTYQCIDCGKSISKGSLRCSKCNGKVHRTSDIDRPTLKYLIRHNPFTKIGKMYNVSDNAIRNWCKRLNLPYRSAEIKKYTDEEWEKI